MIITPTKQKGVFKFSFHTLEPVGVTVEGRIQVKQGRVEIAYLGAKQEDGSATPIPFGPSLIALIRSQIVFEIADALVVIEDGRSGDR